MAKIFRWLNALCLFFVIIFGFSCANESKAEQILNSLSAYEKGVLDHFFRTLFLETTFGYSLFGDKPLSTWVITKPEIHFSYADELAKISAILNEGFRIWEQSGLSKLQNNYYITRCREDHDLVECICVNKKSFLKTADDNISLFQYVLGPKVTSQSLLDQFIMTDRDLEFICHEDKVLNGIILGYGTQNALHVSREEYLRSMNELRDRYAPCEICCGMKRKEPSFNYLSLDQEFAELNDEMHITTSKQSPCPRIPWFGYIDSIESKQLIQQYQKVQKHLCKILSSKNFLETVLTRIFQQPIHVSNASSFTSLLSEKLKSEKHLSNILGWGIYESIRLSDELGTVESFIAGMIDSDAVEYSSCSEVQLRNDRREWFKLQDEDPNENKNALNHRISFQYGQKTWDRYKQLKGLISLDEVIDGMRNTDPPMSNDWIVVNQLELAAWEKITQAENSENSLSNNLAKNIESVSL